MDGTSSHNNSPKRSIHTNSSSNVATRSRGSLTSVHTNYDAAENDKNKKNNISLVREGFSNLSNDGRPKAKVTPTRRGSQATTDRTNHNTPADEEEERDRRTVTRNGDLDSYRNSATVSNGDIGSSSSGGAIGNDSSTSGPMRTAHTNNNNNNNNNSSNTYNNNNNNSSPNNVGQKPTRNEGYGKPRGHKEKGKTTTAQEPTAPVTSVRQRYYETAIMEDVVQDKIATQLRENGVAETRVPSLSAKIAQAVRDDVVAERKNTEPEVLSNLSSTINHFDIILHNNHHHTDMSHLKANDALELSKMVLTRIAKVHDELKLCKSSLDKGSKRSKHQTDNDDTELNGGQGIDDGMVGSTPRGEQTAWSLVMTIKEGIDDQKTEKDIMTNRLKALEQEKEEYEEFKQKHAMETQLWDEENLQLKKYLTEADTDNETLVNKVKEQQEEWDKLHKTVQACRREIDRLKKQNEELMMQGTGNQKDLSSLQSDKARLQVLCDQRLKEILHLRDPDKDLLYQIRTLTDEVTSLRTQTRRLTEEKGMLKAKVQKMEATLDESLKLRNKLTVEKETLFKENQDVRQKVRRLTLATPVQRTLPDIMTPRQRAQSRTAGLMTRASSRAESSLMISKNNIQEENSLKLPTHTEENHYMD